MTKKGVDGKDLKLVVCLAFDCQQDVQLMFTQFSDEFNTPGRTFYPGDDPYFTAVDLWYGVTRDLEVCLHGL